MRAQLEKLPAFTAARRRNWQRLYDRLADSPAAEKLILPQAAENSRPSWFGFLISIRPDSGLSRDMVTRYLETHNIQTRLLFSGNLTRHPCFDPIRGTGAYRVVGGLETTDFVMNNSFWIGVYPGMTDAMLDYMADCLIEAVG